MDCYATMQEIACLFPYLDKSGEYLFARGITLESALNSDHIVKRAIDIVEESLKRMKNRPCVDEPEVEAAASRLALYIITGASNIYLLRRFADSQSKMFTYRLRNTPGIQSYECKAEIASDLGLSVAMARNVVKGSLLAATYPIAIRWRDYIRYAPQDPDWAMINRPVVSGWVLLDVNDFERVLEDAYEAKILKMASREDVGYIVGLLSKVEPIYREIAKLRSLRPVTIRAEGRGEDPPCMRAIIESIRRGENAPHTARFAITTYLLRRGWDVEQIVDLFRSSPDFNEKITRYQVQHIAGQVGGRKEYSVPSCETMNSWGLCPTNLGCGVKNPVQYGRRASRATEASRPQ